MNRLPEATKHQKRLYQTTLAVAVHHQSFIWPEARSTIEEFVSASFKSTVTLEFKPVIPGTGLAALIGNEMAPGKLLLCEGLQLCGEIARLDHGAGVPLLYMYLETTPKDQQVKNIWLLSPQGEQLQIYDHQEGPGMWERRQW